MSCPVHVLSCPCPVHVQSPYIYVCVSQQLGWRVFGVRLTAKTRINALVWIPRNPPKVETSAIAPLIGILSLPCPIDPAAPRLPRCRAGMSVSLLKTMSKGCLPVTCASQNLRKKALYSLLKAFPFPVHGEQLPTRDDPGKEPS
jgi:hypothetical protein